MAKTIPPRKDVKKEDKWDLSSIYKSVDEWEKALAQLDEMIKAVATFKGKLGAGPDQLLAALKEYEKCLLQIETVYHYASLEHEADEDDSTATDRFGRAAMAYTQLQAELSFIDPELMEIDEASLRDWAARPDFADYKVYLEKLLHFKKYTLSEKEERILSLQDVSLFPDASGGLQTGMLGHFKSPLISVIVLYVCRVKVTEYYTSFCGKCKPVAVFSRKIIAVIPGDVRTGSSRRGRRVRRRGAFCSRRQCAPRKRAGRPASGRGRGVRGRRWSRFPRGRRRRARG